MGLCHWLTSCKPSEGKGARRKYESKLNRRSAMRITTPGKGTRESTEHVGGLFFFIFFPCQRAATQCWHGPRAETVHTRLNGNGYRMDISMNAKQRSAGRGLELQRAGLARSIPSQGLIGQVERPDVTPNPSLPPCRSGSLCAPHPPRKT